MKKIMNLVVLSCRKATFLIEKKHVGTLSFLNRLQLSMHLKICDKCSAYQKQSLLIEEAIKNNRQHFSIFFDLKLSDASKIRIQKVLEENLKNN